MQICDIDPITVRRWQNELLEYQNDKDEPYAQTYLKTIHAQLSCVLNYAVAYYSLPKNPCHAAGTIGKSKAEEMSIWTHQQFEHFITFEPKTAYKVAFNILFYSGIREGELLALTPEDFPRNRAVINITKNYAVVDGTEYFLTPKTDKSNRTVTIPESLHKEILQYIDSMLIARDERIFYYQKDGLVSEFKRAIAAAGMEEIRIHDLRHPYVKPTTKNKLAAKAEIPNYQHEFDSLRFLLFCLDVQVAHDKQKPYSSNVTYVS